MRDNELNGIVFAILGSFWISIMLTSVRYLSEFYNPFYITFWRNLIAFLSISLFIIKYKSKIYKTQNVGLFFYRALITAVSITTWFYGLSKLELPYATALSFTAPIFTTIAAIIFLQERPGIRRWMGIIIGFIGMLIIIRPGYRELDFAVLVILFSTTLWAVVSIMVKKLSSTESPYVITFYLGLFLAPLTFPLAYANWQTMQSEHIIAFLILGITANFSQICFSKSLQYTDLTILLPFDFLRLVFVGFFAFTFFSETFDIYQITGSVIIISSSVYIANRERLIKKREQKQLDTGK